MKSLTNILEEWIREKKTIITINPRYICFNEAADHIKGLRLSAMESVVLFSRHGQTNFNVQGRLQTWVPDEDRLTDTGIKQAELLGSHVGLFGIAFAAASDLHRVDQTMKLALPGRDFKSLSCLREYHFGSIGGMTWEGPGSEFAVRYPEHHSVFTDRRFELDLTELGGESYPGFRRRVLVGFFNEILPFCLGGIGFVVTHVSPLREILLSCVLRVGLDKLKPPIDNVSLTAIHFRDRMPPKLLLYNNTEHLPNK